MEQFLKFIAGWVFMYLVFAAVCLLANLKTMDSADCLNDSVVCTLSVIFGWIGGVFFAAPKD